MVACDLLRVVLKCKNKLSAMRRNEAMRARLSEGFAGYLVTDMPVATETNRNEGKCDGSDKKVSEWCFSPFIRYEDMAGGALDAPRWVAAGCMSAKNGEYVGVAVLRAGWLA